MPIARRCSGCGASLGEPTDDDLTVVCRFCGLRHDLNDVAGPAPAVVVELGPRMRRANTVVTVAILGMVALAIGGALLLSYRTSQRMQSTLQQATATTQQRLADTRRALAPAELANLTEYGWKTVDTAPPPGGFAAFEPVAALPWAMAIARAWAADAVLTRIDVGRVAGTGSVDLSGEETSGYRFSSPARALRWRQETDAGTKSTTPTALMLQVQGTAVKALADVASRDEPPAPAAVSLPLPQILTRARAGKGFGDRPFYAGYLIHLPREGWVWYFRAPSGDSFPRVRARDGKVFPY